MLDAFVCLFGATDTWLCRQTPSIRSCPCLDLVSVLMCPCLLGKPPQSIIAIADLEKLKILSLGRNNIKKITGLDELANTLEELWLSYNQIEKLSGLNHLKQLRVLYLSNNRIKNFDELTKLQENPELADLLLTGNPIYEGHTVEEQRAQVKITL